MRNKVGLVFNAVLITAMVVISYGATGANDAEPTATSNEVTIGDQVWMSENLNVDKFRNGDPIPEAKSVEEWKKAGDNEQPAWCYLDNDPANGEKYGKLYNWYAVTDPRGLAPEGWHIPSDDEWNILDNHLGQDGGKKMKSASGWNNNGNGNNSSGFSGLPGGYRGKGCTFYGIDKTGNWWSSTGSAKGGAWGRYLYFGGAFVGRNFFPKMDGLSVRCLRD